MLSRSSILKCARRMSLITVNTMVNQATHLCYPINTLYIKDIYKYYYLLICQHLGKTKWNHCYHRLYHSFLYFALKYPGYRLYILPATASYLNGSNILFSVKPHARQTSALKCTNYKPFIFMFSRSSKYPSSIRGVNQPICFRGCYS